jgi:hypothetical protein
MSIIIHSTCIEVLKFQETGLVALCSEVADPETLETLRRHNADFSRAQFVQENGHLIVRNREPNDQEVDA